MPRPATLSGDSESLYFVASLSDRESQEIRSKLAQAIGNAPEGFHSEALRLALRSRSRLIESSWWSRPRTSQDARELIRRAGCTPTQPMLGIWSPDDPIDVLTLAGVLDLLVGHGEFEDLLLAQVAKDRVCLVSADHEGDIRSYYVEPDFT